MAEGFFQTQARLTTPAAPTPQTVSQLTARIDKAIKTGVPGQVLVRGEISNLKPHRASGHLYFTLKDSSACIDCVMWKDAAAALRFTPNDGLETIASGRVSVYAERGKYQLYVNSLSPVGQGALELAFRQMKERLQKEGLFAAERKKPIPRYPLRIALVTSAATAALQDMLKVLKRFPWLTLLLLDVPVQGDSAAPKIAAALTALNQRPAEFDVILLARGGGSLEDLWAFNEETVARAIAASEIPIVTGIGHEVDISIADLVADHHAHTPTEAAQVVVFRWQQVDELLQVLEHRLQRALLQIAQDAMQRLKHIQRHEFFRRPLDRIRSWRQTLDDRQGVLTLHVSSRLRKASSRLAGLDMRLLSRHPRHAVALANARLAGIEKSLNLAILAGYHKRLARLDGLDKHLRAIGPEQVLRRGFTITSRKKDGQPVRSAAEVKAGEQLVTRFPDGTVESTVDDPRQPRLFP